MQVFLIGTSAGGGVPQWNCNCAGCAQARGDETGKYRRLHASLAFSASGKNWYLINATPDVRFQIESCPALVPGPAKRSSPIKGILLTDAELDHTIGLLVLRENASIEVLATANALHALNHSFPVATMLEHYSSYKWTEVVPNQAFYVDDGRIEVEAVEVGTKPPKYVREGEAKSNSPWVIGYRLTDSNSARSILVIPQLDTMSEQIMDLATGVDLLFIDGTCSYEDDLEKAGVGKTRSSQMGHLPLFSEGGIVSGINEINNRRRSLDKSQLRTVLLHINNTNPILIEGSVERETALRNGIELGQDGSTLEI